MSISVASSFEARRGHFTSLELVATEYAAFPPRSLIRVDRRIATYSSSESSSELSSSDSSALIGFFAGFFFFFLFFGLELDGFDRGSSSILRISSSVIFLSLFHFCKSGVGGAANR